MTIHALRAERAEIVNLLAVIQQADERLVFDGISMIQGNVYPGKRGLIALGFAHRTLGNLIRYHAENGLF